MAVAAAPRLLPRPREPACSSSSSPTTAMRPVPPIPPRTSTESCALTLSRSAAMAATSSAFDMPAAPYPLGGEAAAVVEDIVRLGGMPVIAHPDSPKPELAWRAWSAPAGGVEWLNLDSAWRDEPFGRLARIAVGSFFRPAPALAMTLARPAELLATWDRMASNRAVVGLAGHDAHGGLRRAEEYRGDQGWSLPGFGSYEVAFRTFSTRVILDAPLSGDPDRRRAAALPGREAGKSLHRDRRAGESTGGGFFGVAGRDAPSDGRRGPSGAATSPVVPLKYSAGSESGFVREWRRSFELDEW